MNPFRGIPNPKTVFAWGVYDLANQSFTLMINTLFFGIFVSEVVMGGEAGGDRAWSWMGSISLAVVALLGPALGALGDAKGWKKKFLFSTGFFCAAMTIALSFIPKASEVGMPTALTIAFLIYVPANIAFNIGENFLASFLPEISNRENMGRVSAIGWTMGYVGALMLLVILVIVIKQMQLNSPEDWRPLFAFAGAWFGLMMIPPLLKLPKEKQPPVVEGNSVATAFSRMGQTVREVGKFRDLAWLFASLLIYGMGYQVILFFAAKIAKDDFDFTTEYLVGFTAVLTIFAGISAFSTGFIQEKLGLKATLISYLALWIVVAGGLAGTSYMRSEMADPSLFPQWPIWLVGIGIGLGLGGIGTATRAAVGLLTPSHRTAEFFGIWGTTVKLAGVIGLPIFGEFRESMGSVPSLIILTGFFLVGGLMVAMLVNINRGRENAEAIDLA